MDFVNRTDNHIRRLPVTALKRNALILLSVLQNFHSMKTIYTLLLIISSLLAFSSDSIPRPLKWGFKLNYEAIRSVPQYLYTIDNIKASRYQFTYLNIGFSFQIFEKNQKNYHEISLSRLWSSNHNEGYRYGEVNLMDSAKFYRDNKNFQIGLRYSYYLQLSGKKKESPHKFLLEFPIEVFYHSNSANWANFSGDTAFRYTAGYTSDVVGFSFGVTPHYHYFFGNRAYLDIAIPVAYTGMYSFTYSLTDNGNSFIEKRGSGYFNGFSDIIPFSLRISLGVKLYALQKRKTKKSDL